MLTGVPPFQADTPHAYLMMHSSVRPKAMRDVNPTVSAPPELEAVILRAREKDRSKRFATAREFAQAIERLMPTLSDAAGAPPPLPLTAEVTDEATRVVPRPNDAATVLSSTNDAVTVATEAPAAPEQVIVEPAKRRPIAAIAAMLVIVLAAAGWLLTQRKSEPAPVVAAAALPQKAKPIEVPVAPAHLGINALPWAKVTNIRNLDNGQEVELQSDLVTPAPIDLAPGRYEVTLSNPNFDEPVKRTVSVEAGRDEMLHVSFTEPNRAKLPDFGGAE